MPALKNAKHEAFAQALARDDFYVYELADPRDGSTFYVGKGRRARMRQHVAAVRRHREPNADKALRISEIHAAGLEVVERKVWADLTEREAIRLERKRIAYYGLANLTNRSPGEVSALDRSKVRAKATLARMKGRNLWLTERARTETEIALADLVRRELSKIAAHGQILTAVVSASGVEFS